MQGENFTYEDIRSLALDNTKKTLKDYGGSEYLDKLREVLYNLKINAKTKRDLLRIKKCVNYSETIIRKRLERILVLVLFDFVNNKNYNEELKYASKDERELYNFIYNNLQRILKKSIDYIENGTQVKYVNEELVMVRVLEPIESMGMSFEAGEIALIPLNIAKELEIEGKVERLEL